MSFRNIKLLNDEITALRKQIDPLDEDNLELSKIVHKYNKLIPAIYYSVSSLLQSVITKNIPKQDWIERAKLLQDDLLKISRDRYDFVSKYEKVNRNIPVVQMPTVDVILSYMHSSATSQNIYFDITVHKM